jgi:hypothetical protein
MTRHILIAIAALLALGTAHATRVLDQVENGFELTLADLHLPAAGGETISFSACPRCGINTHRLTDTTVFKVNGRQVPLAEFLRITAQVSERPADAARTFAGVFLDIASGRVTRIELREPATN